MCSKNYKKLRKAELVAELEARDVEQARREAELKKLSSAMTVDTVTMFLWAPESLAEMRKQLETLLFELKPHEQMRPQAVRPVREAIGSALHGCWPDEDGPDEARERRVSEALRTS